MSVPPEDPPRLLDPGSLPSDPLRRMLAAGRADGPDPDQIARIAARAAGLGAPPGGGPGGAPGAPPPPVWSLPAVKAGVAAIVLGLAGGGYAIHRSGAESPGAAPAAPAMSAATVAEPDATPALAPEPLPAPPPAESATPSALPIAASAPTPIAPPRRAPPGPAATPAASASAAPPPAESGASEMELVDRAQRALTSSPATALALADEHAARFGRGSLAPEREVIAISALVALGRRGEARARAARFHARYPSSAYRRRIEVLIAKPE